MAELLLELFSEEIPARMQAKAEADLRDAVEKALKEAGLKWKLLAACSGPRRLTVSIDGLSERSADVKEERKGPKVGAPEKALEGFLRGAGLTDISQAQIASDPKKGDFYVAVIETPGRDAAEIIAEAVPAIIRGFHWPKSMRWGTGDLRWVRPLQRITCVLDGKVVPFDVDGIASGNEVEGHRVHGRGPYTVTGWKDYSEQLETRGHVKLSRADRREVILKGIQDVCKKAGLEWIEDQGLLEEVTGLAEWPVVVLGDMDPDFLSLPPEVITLSMRTHQKYFAVNDKKTGKLAPHFVVVANIDAADGGRKIAEGNARVLSARLEDARFFWDKDKATPLDEMAKKLSTIAFKAELGSLGDKVERVAALAPEILQMNSAARQKEYELDERPPEAVEVANLAVRAAELSKADLVSEMVGEFPELQGTMGRYYALEAGEPAVVADAIRDHYRPQGPSDSVPVEPVSVALALADKLDTLVCFWLIGETPTGSKDPYALRRAALGFIRILLENGTRLELFEAVRSAYETWYWQHTKRGYETKFGTDGLRYLIPHGAKGLANYEKFVEDKGGTLAGGTLRESNCVVVIPDKIFDSISSYDDLVQAVEALPVYPGWGDVLRDLLSFFADRLKQYLRDQGQRHDLIDAVFALGEDDLVLITKRVQALGDFLGTEDGANLLAGYKRAANILKAEKKKGTLPDNLVVDGELTDTGPKQERKLHQTLGQVRHDIEAPLEAEDFAAVMTELAKLREPVDAFFEHVMVNDDDPAIRANRLALLVDIRDTLHRVADFSLIEG